MTLIALMSAHEPSRCLAGQLILAEAIWEARLLFALFWPFVLDAMYWATALAVALSVAHGEFCVVWSAEAPKAYHRFTSVTKGSILRARQGGVGTVPNLPGGGVGTVCLRHTSASVPLSD